MLNDFQKYNSMVTKEASVGSAPTAFQKYLEHVKRANLPGAAKMVQEIMSRNSTMSLMTGTAVVESGQKKLAEAVYEHVMGKMASESQEDILSVIEFLDGGINKMASETDDVDSPEFIEKVLSSLQDGSFFELYKEDDEFKIN